MGGPGGPHGPGMPPGGPPGSHGMGPQPPQDPYGDNFDDEEFMEGKKKRGKKVKEPKPPKEPKEKKPRQYNRKKKPVPGALGEDDMEKVEIPMDSMLPTMAHMRNDGHPLPHPQENGDVADSPNPQIPNDVESEEAKTPKPLLKLKSKTPSKAKPSKTLLQFTKKKRKRSNSEGSDADMDKTPPPSPPDEESGIEKRRSGRNTKRKKYVDDVQYNFSDDDKMDLNKDDKQAASSGAMDDILGPDALESTENSLGPDTESFNPSSGPNYAFIDPTAEDTMIVQFILTTRTGKRELEESEEESLTKPKEEPKETE